MYEHKKLPADECSDGICGTCETNEPDLPTCGETVDAAHTPFPGGGTDRPVAAVRFVPDRPASGSGRISRTVGHARGIPDKNRRNQRVNLLNIYPDQQDDWVEGGGYWDAVQMGFSGAYYYARLGFNF